ncbi:MAG: hypothetical protein OXG66_11070, partial [Acidimicrobiaceae bacterium]|nr:hypothetical protein [Acidimicrobiaceae bacterium]
IHHHGWREVPDGRGLYTIVPPERIRHGPARAPDPPPGHRPSPPRAAMPPGAGPASTAAPDRAGQAGSSPARAQSPEPLFTLA